MLGAKLTVGEAVNTVISLPADKIGDGLLVGLDALIDTIGALCTELGAMLTVGEEVNVDTALADSPYDSFPVYA